MKLIVRNIGLVDGTIRRRQIKDIIDDYVAQHPQFKRLSSIVVAFEEDPRDDYGKPLGGWQYKNRITVGSRNAGEQVTIFRLVITLYHELEHMLEWLTSKQRKLKMSSYYEDSLKRRPEERRAVRASVHHMLNWIEKEAEGYAAAELRALSSHPQQWPKN